MIYTTNNPEFDMLPASQLGSKITDSYLTHGTEPLCAEILYPTINVNCDTIEISELN